MEPTVAVDFPKTRYDPARTLEIPEWGNLPVNIHPRAQVHHDNGRGWPGSVRYMRSNGKKWTYTNGSLKGAGGSSRMRRFNIGKTQYGRHKLVLTSFCGEPVGERTVPCHIAARRIDEEPDDRVSNLYWGTNSDNMADDVEKKGRALVGNQRAFRGRPYGVEEWSSFEAIRVAVEVTGAAQTTISSALRTGKRVGKEKWELEYVHLDVRCVELKMFADREGATKFATSDGRVGENKKTKNGIVRVQVPLNTDASGYILTMFAGKLMRLHRVIALLFMRREIDAKVFETRIPFEKLQVDHVDGVKNNNHRDNLRIVTAQEHNSKHARAVLALDENRVPTGERWDSTNSAGRANCIDPSIIYGVCIGRGKTAGGRLYCFEEEYLFGYRRGDPQAKVYRNL